MNAKTIAQKIWDAHVVTAIGEQKALIYIDFHLMHEINTPPAFDGLREKKIRVHRPDRTLATEDHNTPTTSSLFKQTNLLNHHNKLVCFFLKPENNKV